MKSQCPLCYSPLEVRDVAPCYVCGGWPDAVARFDPAARFAEYRLPGGQTLVLCRGCELEEFMVPGGWGFRLIPDETRPINSLRLVRMVDRPQVARDKFCASCNVRLAFAETIADTQRQTSPDT